MIHEYAADDIAWFRSVFEGGLTPGGRTVDDFDAALAEHDRKLSRKVWFEGASSRQCHCNAYSEGECGCGMWPSEGNPYLLETSTPQYTTKEKP